MKKFTLFALAGILSLVFAEAPAIYKKCQMCHGPTGQKMAPGAKHLIAGQPKDKLLADLKGYKAGTADNGGNKRIMYAQMKNVSDEDIEALAEFISKLPAK